jgi:hypothetical protein
MDMNGYAIETIARQHLAELRADAARRNMAWVAGRPRRPLRVGLGYALVRLGNRLLGGFAAVRAPA